jgi:putative IMPACT (imprinted ancient) family translation regulator
MKITPKQDYSYSTKVLGSSFIALLGPLSEGLVFEDVLTKIKKDYPKATHYVYAYLQADHEKCSDDGEPAHSSGRPLLELLKKKELSQVYLVVVRYFGGSKLGLGRLTRTYLSSGEEVIKEAAFAEIMDGIEAEILLDYPHFESVKKEADRLGVEVKVLSYDERVRLLLVGDAKIVPSLIGSLKKEELLKETSITYLRSIL